MSATLILKQGIPEPHFDKHGIDGITPLSNLFPYFLLRETVSRLALVSHPPQKNFSCAFLLIKGQARGLLSQGYLSLNLMNHSSSRGQQTALPVDLVRGVHNQQVLGTRQGTVLGVLCTLPVQQSQRSMP